MMKECALYCAVLCFGVAAVAFAQDAAKVDPTHYKVEFENAQVRILRFHYGPHEKSVMHSHPDSVAMFLTDGSVKFTFPDGKTQDASGKAGVAQFTPATVHLILFPCAQGGAADECMHPTGPAKNAVLRMTRALYCGNVWGFTKDFLPRNLWLPDERA
jgi:quercetin dioxygenase-like cupin family protein